MARHSILEPNPAQPAGKPQSFSREDATSPTVLAERDLYATLQLLAERARYLCGASGVSIALRDGRAMICRASAGPSAMELGSRIRIDSGLIAESLRVRQILRCDDAERDPRLSRETWQRIGIRSAMLGPLVRLDETVGIFELLADRTSAFDDRDITTLQRLSDMTLTALENFAHDNSRIEASSAAPKLELAIDAPASPELTAIPATVPAALQLAPTLRNDHPPQNEPLPLNVHQCRGCGFPVSLSRTLCLDCEESQSSEGLTPTHLFAVREPGWLQSHLYTMGTLFIAALTVALLVLKFR